MKKFGFVSIVLFSLFAQSAMADLFGLANGRSANLDNMADMSVEGGANVGDGNLFGARVNFKASSDLMVFGDVGLYDGDNIGADLDGLVFGFGAFYQLRNVTLLENTDLAVKGAYHLGTLESSFTSPFGGSASVDIDVSEITIDGLISGDQLGSTGFGWYGNVGIHIVDFESASDTEPLFGGGITGTLSFGEFFAGVDVIDGLLLVGGIRYNL